MTITINFAPQPAPGYVPRKARVLHNVEAVLDNGVRAVRVKMQFSDLAPTYDHVVSVVSVPDREVL